MDAAEEKFATTFDPESGDNIQSEVVADVTATLSDWLEMGVARWVVGWCDLIGKGSPPLHSLLAPFLVYATERIDFDAVARHLFDNEFPPPDETPDTLPDEIAECSPAK